MCANEVWSKRKVGNQSKDQENSQFFPSGQGSHTFTHEHPHICAINLLHASWVQHTQPSHHDILFRPTLPHSRMTSAMRRMTSPSISSVMKRKSFRRAPLLLTIDTRVTTTLPKARVPIFTSSLPHCEISSTRPSHYYIAVSATNTFTFSIEVHPVQPIAFLDLSVPSSPPPPQPSKYS